jgi:Fe2+ transport system protein B
MAELVAIFLAFFTYFVMFKLLFENFEELIEVMKNSFFSLPLVVILDYPSKKLSLKLIFWLATGVIAGIYAYFMFK